MAISAFLLAILEQAKEPLHCLHGAGYFTTEEWIQLDLIMNKEYTWTKGPPDTFYRNSIDRATHLKHENSLFFAKGRKDAPSLDAISLCASIEPPMSDINTSPGSVEAPWNFPIGTMNGKPFESSLPSKSDFIPSVYSPGQRQSSSYTSILGEEFQGPNVPSKENISGYPLSAVGSDGKSPLSSSARKMKSISAWTSEVQNNTTRQVSGIHSNIHAPSISSQLKKRSSRSPRSNFTEDRLKGLKNDVNIFETSNAAEWHDDVSRALDKSGPKKKKIYRLRLMENMENNILEVTNSIVLEGQNKKYRQQVSSTTNVSSRIATRTSNRVVDVSRLKYYKESKDQKSIKDNDTGTQQKTRVCWFWAESPGGCRYKQDECLNLHVKPTLNGMSKHLYEDRKSARTPGGGKNIVKSLTCWSWASTGTCSGGDGCKDVHGWVIGGVSSGPQKNLDPGKSLDKEAIEHKKKGVISVKTPAKARATATINQNKQDTNVMELVDLRSNEHDADDCNPPQSSVLMSLDPSFNSSSIQ
ncbi:hypothetical protein EPUL_002636, partial [Erysiphe pulchra]